MTNLEKYKKEILRLVDNDATIAVSKKDLRPCYCIDTECTNCLFSPEDCHTALIEWLCQEYQDPAPKLTKAERGFCEIVKTGYIARDAVKKCLVYYSEEPEKDLNGYYWYSPYDSVELPLEPFSFITWGDEKPWSIEDLLKLEVKE